MILKKLLNYCQINEILAKFVLNDLFLLLWYYMVNYQSNYRRHNYSLKMLSNNSEDTFHLLSLRFY